MERTSDVAHRLKEYRNRFDYTLADLSEKCHIPAQTLNRYELGKESQKLILPLEIAEALGINPLWLQGYDVPIENQLPPEENKPAEPELDELDKEFIRLVARLTPEQRRRQIEVLQDIVGRKDT